jgi:hypothetical protein
MYKDPSLENKYFAWFILFGFEGSPDEITKQLGVEPTETRIKGEHRTIGKGKHAQERLNKENAWLLKSELSRDVPIEKHLEHLMNKIKPHKQNFIDVAKKYELQFNCAVYYYEANPGISLESNIMKEISELDIPLYFDIYCMAGTVSQFEQENAYEQLTRQLSEINSVSEFNDGEHNEANSLAKSLIEIDAARSNLDMHMEDLVVWDDLEDELYKEKMDKVTEDLKRIIKAIKQSKSLNNLLDEEKNN